MRHPYSIVGTLLLLGIASLTYGQALTIGSDAPAIRVERWLKSSPVPNFEKGKLYVVDFWSTWCPPCKLTIPHLSQLAKKLSGKVIFSGVSILEEQKSLTDLNYVSKVQNFVNSEGVKMEYHVAVDRPDRWMATAWMDASGEQGMPTAFVIDRQGKVAWIGNPLEGLDTVLDQEIAGTYDLRSAAVQRAKMKAEESNRVDPQANGSVAALVEAIRVKDWKAAARTCSVIIATDRTQETKLGTIKFLALLQMDPQAAYSYARRLSAGLYKDSPRKLSDLSEMILSDEYGPKKPDVGFALDLAQQANGLSRGEDPSLLDTLANAQFRANEPEKAIATEKSALLVLDSTKRYPKSELDRYRRLIEKHLETMRAKKR